MFIQPQGPQITAERAQALDDDFYTSRPFEFFASRITALLDPMDPADVPKSPLAADLAALLGCDSVRGLADIGQADRELQTALDAFIIRHHVAEALVRLYWALTTGRRNSSTRTHPWSVWVAVNTSPTQNAELVEATRANLHSEQGRADFVNLVIPDDISSGLSSGAAGRVDVMGNWLVHAMRLLGRTGIDINAAHNKIKHGLAVGSRDDLKISIVWESDGEGSVPVGAFSAADAIDLINTISVDYLSQPRDKPKQGLEITTLNLPPAILLAESWMMAVTYGAMFHLAAAQHFQGRHDVRLPTYPQIPNGPTPHQLLGESVIGIRHPVTMPPGGGPILRGAGYATHETFTPLQINYAAVRDGVIVDD